MAMHERERGWSSRWRSVVMITSLGLGCDLLPSSESEEVAAKPEVAGEPTKADAKPEAKADAKPEAKADAKPSTDAKPSPDAKAPEPVPPAEPTAVAPPTEPAAAPPAEPIGVAPPTEPAAPADPAPAAVPPLPAALPTAPASEAALSEKMKRRLRSKLREQHDALVSLPAAAALTDPTGSVTVLGLYEYSEVEACISKTDGSKEARKACANARTDDNDRPLPALRKCTLRGLVRARFGPPPKSNVEYGGALEILATRPLTGGCTITKVRDLSLSDVDGDGQLELAVDVISKTPESPFVQDEDFEDGDELAGIYDVFTRTIGWYRADLSPQYAADLSSWHTELIEAVTDGTSRRVRLEDANGDGRPDLRFDTVQYDAAECEFEDDGWLKMAADPEDGCAGKVVTTEWLYDPAKDQWVEPSG